MQVDIAEDRISIFGTGPGMDDNDENSIMKWYGILLVYNIHLMFNT